MKNVANLTLGEIKSNQEKLENGRPEISLLDVKNVFIQTSQLGKNRIEFNGNSENITVSQLNGKPDIINKMDNKEQLRFIN